jgi:hypothetical protein
MVQDRCLGRDQADVEAGDGTRVVGLNQRGSVQHPLRAIDMRSSARVGATMEKRNAVGRLE